MSIKMMSSTAKQRRLLLLQSAVLSMGFLGGNSLWATDVNRLLNEGSAIEQYNAGCRLLEGTAEDRQNAVRLFESLAAQGYTAAMHNLAYCLREGLGVAKNLLLFT